MRLSLNKPRTRSLPALFRATKAGWRKHSRPARFSFKQQRQRKHSTGGNFTPIRAQVARSGAEPAQPWAKLAPPWAQSARPGARVARPGAKLARPWAEVARSQAKIARPGAEVARPWADFARSGAGNAPHQGKKFHHKKVFFETVFEKKPFAGGKSKHVQHTVHYRCVTAQNNYSIILISDQEVNRNGI